MARPLLRLVSGSSAGSKASSGRPPIDDAQLLAALHAGDEAAAAELHDRLRPRVDATLRSLLGPGHGEHDDLAQQSFVEIVLSLPRYRGECSLETWAGTIAARTVFKFLRRRTTERRVFKPSEEDDLEPVSQRSLGRELVARQLAARIRRHLDALDPLKCEAFLLHDVCGFDAREIAGIMEIGEAAAHARISRGRRELQKRLEGDPDLAGALLDMEVGP
jgi:RNA polymerase sigma-70 factor (ECF subfamily)